MSNSSIVKPGQQKEFRYRILLFSFIVYSILVIILFRIFYIQVIKSKAFSQRSTNFREKIVRIPPIRGRIISSDNKILADNMVSYNLYINNSELPENLEHRQKVILQLSRIMNYDYADIEKRILQNKSKVTDTLIAENISFESFLKIKEFSHELIGISIKEILVRYYPFKTNLSHGIGYIAPIDSNELSIYKKDGYLHNDFIGKIGLEKYYEKELRGEEGQRVYEMDARMRIQKELFDKSTEAKPGYELHLTISQFFQKNVEDILADRMGAILVLKPSNGEILAMASFPTFDPNIYILQNDVNEEIKKQIALDTKGTPLINRTIQAVYPPGSTFKMVAGAAVVEENIISPEKQYFCTGSYRLGNQIFKCWKLSGHGWDDLNKGIADSCDVYFYNAGLAIGPEKLAKFAKTFGFGNRLGVDLNFEQPGLIPDPEWKKSISQIWYQGDTLNSVIGQGDVKVTLLQIANYIALIANNGHSYKPHLLKEIRSSLDGSLIKTIEREQIYSLNLKDDVYERLKKGMLSVVYGGTTTRSFMTNKFKIAGKSGTAEVGFGQKKQVHSWFTGFGPVDQPIENQIVVVVFCEFQNYNVSKYAPSIASMVFSSYLLNEDFHTTAKRLGYPIKDSYNN